MLAGARRAVSDNVDGGALEDDASPVVPGAGTGKTKLSKAELNVTSEGGT